MKTYLGIDGCSSGWLTVKITEDDSVTLSIYDSIRSLWTDNQDAELILIDIPIGLPDSGNGTRACDIEARKVLKPYRASSVYSVPCRKALYAEDYKQASAINKKLTGKGLSKQSWMISPKIREVDTFLLWSKDARAKIREIHPEVLFWALNEGRTMKHNKKTDDGVLERIAVIEQYSKLYAEILKGNERVNINLLLTQKPGYARDDVVDAFAAAITAKFSEGKIDALTGSPLRDEEGLPMEMVYWKFE